MTEFVDRELPIRTGEELDAEGVMMLEGLLPLPIVRDNDEEGIARVETAVGQSIDERASRLPHPNVKVTNVE